MEDEIIFERPAIELAAINSGSCQECARCKNRAGAGCHRRAARSGSGQSVSFAGEPQELIHLMTNVSKAFLVLSIGGLAAGGIVASGTVATNNVGLLMAMPVGAIAVGGLLIFRMMEKEMNRFDREETERHQLAERRKAAQVPGRRIP